MSCIQLGEIKVTALPAEDAGCNECLKPGGRWLDPRACEVCGQIGCCDRSPDEHATAPCYETLQPIIRLAEPGEGWSCCCVDELAFELG